MKTKFIQVLVALILPISFIIILVGLNAIPMPPISKYGLGGILLTAIAFLLTYLVIKKEKKTFKDIGFYLERKTPVRFTIGFIIGCLVTITMVAIVILFSNVELNHNSNSNIASVLFWLLAFFPLAFMEEIIFRGYAFMKINENFGLWPAQILMALLFTWYHDFTGVTFFSQLMGPGIWAFIYGLAAVWSKGLAFPTGLHMAINVVLALIGQKDDRHAIWHLEFATDVNPTINSQADNIGLGLQICILIVAIVLTEYYRRNKFKKAV